MRGAIGVYDGELGILGQPDRQRTQSQLTTPAGNWSVLVSPDLCGRW